MKLRPARIAASLALGLAVAGLAVATLVVSHPGASDAPPHAVSIPAPEPGQAASYNITRTLQHGTEEGTLSLRWSLGPVQDARGHWIQALVLDQVYNDGRDTGNGAAASSTAVGPSKSTFAFAADGSPILSRTPDGGVWASADAGVLGFASHEASGLQFYAVAFASGPWLCGVAPLARTLDDGPAPLSGACGAGNGTFTVTADGIQAHATRGKSTVTFGNGLAFPTAAHIVGSSGTWDYVLTGVAAAPSTATARLPADTHAAPMTPRPTSAMGPDAGGIPVVYSLQQAFQDAQSEPNLQLFLAQHPGWWLSAGSMYSVPQPGNEAIGWTFTVEGGADAAHVRVESQVDTLGLPTAWPAGVPHTFTGAAGVDVEPSQVVGLTAPAALPSPADVFATWQAYNGGATGGVNQWGFSVSCAATCKEAQARVWAGNVSRGYASATANALGIEPPASAHVNHTFSGVVVDGGGQVVGRREAELTYVKATVTPLAGAAAATPMRPASAYSSWSLVGPAPVAVGALSLAAALVYAIWPLVKPAAVGLFSRVQHDRVLDHPSRRRIMDAVEAQPGIHFQALARLTSSGQGALDHHLRKLEAASLLVRREAAGYVCYFPAHSTDARTMAAAGALKSDGARRILATIARKPGQAAQDVAAAAGLDPSTVTHHVQRLTQAGLVDARREGRTVRLSATALGDQAVIG